MEFLNWKMDFGRFRDDRAQPSPNVLCFFASWIITVVFFAAGANGQELPGKIRGYKVHQAKIVVKTADERPENGKDVSKYDAFVTIGEPKLKKISVAGVTFELTAELDSIEQSGTVDFLTFHDFRVNGLKVDMEEYRESFDFKKNETIILPKPFEIFVGTPQTLLGALGEITDSKDRWRVTGRVFVFGRFKKSIFNFKRVVPLDIDIMIDNPTRSVGIKEFRGNPLITNSKDPRIDRRLYSPE